MKKLIALLIIGTLISSCGNESSKIKNNYSIIKEDKNEKIKKVNIEIRLKEEISETDLKEIALSLKEDRKNFKMLWIFYYLPGQKTGNGAWASTHFSPDLEVKILGVTKEASEDIKKIKVTGEIINSWFDNDAIMPNTTYLVKEDNKLYMKSLYPKNSLTDASEIIREVIEKKKGKTIRYDYENNHGEYFLIEKNGNLGMYDSEGKFKEATKEKK